MHSISSATEREHAYSKVWKAEDCFPGVGAMCVMIISTAFHIQKSFGANLASLPSWTWCYPRTAEGVPQLAAGPATMTTCLCSSGGLLLSPWRPAACSIQWGLTFRVYLEKDAEEPHNRCTSLSRMLASSLTQFESPLDGADGDENGPLSNHSLSFLVVTYSSLLLLYVLLCVCDWLLLSLSRSWTWINHEDTRLLCSYNKTLTSPYHTHTRGHTQTHAVSRRDL